MTARNNGIGDGTTFDRPAVGQRSPKVKAPFGSARQPLKKSSPSRHLRAADYLAAIGQAKIQQQGRCAGHLAGIDHDCTEPFDFAHLVAQRTVIRDLGEGHPALADPRLGIYVCRKIHADFDNWSGELRDPVQRAALAAQAHPDLESALTEYGLTARFEREVYGA